MRNYEDLPQFEKFSRRKSQKEDPTDGSMYGFTELSWLENFLYSKVGQSWDQVRSEITHRFDRRTGKRRGVFFFLENFLSKKFEVIDGILYRRGETK